MRSLQVDSIKNCSHNQQNSGSAVIHKELSNVYTGHHTVYTRLNFNIRYDMMEEFNVDSKAEYTA